MVLSDRIHYFLRINYSIKPVRLLQRAYLTSGLFQVNRFVELSLYGA